MDLKLSVTNSVDEIFPMFGLTAEFQGEIEEAQLSSANPVNVLIGLSGGIKGSIVIGLKRPTALKIVSSMMGGMEVNSLDSIAKSALGEAANMIVGSTVAKLQASNVITSSPPTLVTGERVFLVISRVKSRKLSFRMNDDMFNISYCIEE